MIHSLIHAPFFWVVVAFAIVIIAATLLALRPEKPVKTEYAVGMPEQEKK